MNTIDKAISYLAPQWGLARARARAAVQAFSLAARHFDAASGGHRTENWRRKYSDANAANGPALSELRAHARDLQRNNAWAQNGLRAIGRNTVGWGIIPSADTKNEAAKAAAAELWKEWADSTQCDADGRSTFYGLQRQIIETVARDGEVLVRLRSRSVEDGLAIPLQLQVLEADFLDTSKDGATAGGFGRIVQGVEFDSIGRRVAYWLFEEHPGATLRGIGGKKLESKRVPAEGVVHVFRQERPGQVRGISWLAAAIVALKDFDEFEDATIVRQKIAALFAVFVTDPDGSASPLGVVTGAATATAPAVESLEPGMIKTLTPGQNVSFASPPSVVNDEFTKRTLQKVAAAIGVTYEDLTGDFSEVNFSSARMARLAHWSNVHDWRWNMLISQFCAVVWARAMKMAVVAGRLAAEIPVATWTPPSMPMIEPDKEGLAFLRLVRAGGMTHDEMVREQGHDPDTFWDAYAAGLKKLDDRGIILDSDARKTTQQGLSQQVNASKGAAAAAAEGGV